jgi:DinB family protein
VDEPLIDRLTETPKAAAHLVAELSDERLDAPAADGGWPVRTILAHLRDDEYLCMRLNLERALAEHNPAVQFVDGADWEHDRSRERDRKELLLADFALQRQASVNILRGLRPADWERAMQTEHGALSIRQLVEAWAQHSEEHIAQLESAIGETVAQARARRARVE